MPPKTLNLRPMGADAADAAAALAKREEEAASRVKALEAQACIECGLLGSWDDGDFWYCKEHVPHELRNRGTYWRKDYEK